MTGDQYIIIGVGLFVALIGGTGLIEKTRRGQMWVRLFGPLGARIFYVIMGLTFCALAFIL